MAKHKHRISITIDGEIVKRVGRLAKASNRSRSAMIEQLIRDGVEDAEMTVQAFTDPVLLQAFAGAFGNRDVLKAMASAVHEEMTDVQLDLFVDRLKGLARDAGKSDERVRGSGRREAAKRGSKG